MNKTHEEFKQQTVAAISQDIGAVFRRQLRCKE
jgi:hypothetical protein